MYFISRYTPSGAYSLSCEGSGMVPGNRKIGTFSAPRDPFWEVSKTFLHRYPAQNTSRIPEEETEGNEHGEPKLGQEQLESDTLILHPEV